MKKIPLNNISKDVVGFALIDNADFNIISKYKWYLDSVGYASTMIGRKPTRMHRLILTAKNRALITDHINCNKLDNRRCNLRLATRIQNNFNKNISGVRYVNGKWQSRIRYKQREISIGLFKTKMQAEYSYKIFRKMLMDLESYKIKSDAYS